MMGSEADIRITLKIVDQPVTRGLVVKALPWLAGKQRSIPLPMGYIEQQGRTFPIKTYVANQDFDTYL